tara:strand:- start:268 stop:1089 length:822 start_codon:yes stop_codon:yes gene_type:complete
LNKNIIFGASGLVGLSLIKRLKNKKNYIYFSKNNNNFKKFNLDKNINKLSIKKIDTCYFFASPRIKKINFNNNKFKYEFNWLKNVILNIKIRKFVYLSSSSIYNNKNHIIGSIKNKCEKYIIKNKKKFIYYQIWRPFNLVGKSYYNSDHFHNFLFKIMFIKKKKKFKFEGNSGDKRGYSDVDAFTKTLYNFSKKNISFVKDYGNRDVVSVSKIVDLYNLNYKKIYHKKFSTKFKSKRSNTNCVALKKNNVYYDKKSIIVLRNYLKNSLIKKIN